MPDISPTNKWVAVAPSDSVELLPYTDKAMMTAGLYIGTGGGDVACVDQSDDVTVFTGVPAGTTLRVAVRRVNVSGTSAASIVALYWV